MGYRQAKMLEDINGDLIPQYWDVAEQKFKPLTNNPQDVRLTGSIVEDILFEGITVNPGSEINHRSKLISNELLFGLRLDTGGIRWRVTLEEQIKVDSSYRTVGVTEIGSKETRLDVFDLMSHAPYIYVRLGNTGDEPFEIFGMSFIQKM